MAGAGSAPAALHGPRLGERVAGRQRRYRPVGPGALVQVPIPARTLRTGPCSVSAPRSLPGPASTCSSARAERASGESSGHATMFCCRRQGSAVTCAAGGLCVTRGRTSTGGRHKLGRWQEEAAHHRRPPTRRVRVLPIRRPAIVCCYACSGHASLLRPAQCAFQQCL